MVGKKEKLCGEKRREWGNDLQKKRKCTDRNTHTHPQKGLYIAMVPGKAALSLKSEEKEAKNMP